MLNAPEFDRIARAFGWGTDPRGIGDDAALLDGGRIFCCDALCEGVHFRLDWSSPADVGWKAVAANVADVLAMGGTPDAAVWSVGMGGDWGDAVFSGLAEGALEACRHFGCSLVGGDTVRADGPGFASLALLGTLRATRAWTRGGARPGDVLVLLGTRPGSSAAGLAALEAGAETEPAWSGLVDLHRRPRPPLSEAGMLFGRDVHAAIDLSDGLSSEARHMAEASGVRLALDADALGADPPLRDLARHLGLDPASWVLHGGEDHSLLLAVGPETGLPAGTLRIGHVESGAGVLLRGSGRAVELEPGGWRHP